MRLFGVVSGSVDRRDRAEWLTPVFDRAFATPSEVPTIAATVYGPNPNATVYGPNPNATIRGS